ncbi:hypothetical protein DCW30_31690 [Streptomyces alfalfae]|uniref:WXG100 family type VII secretion target n=1 Tax=Streptomyces alfalfae TaxID=1642299 RepID=A0ABN4VR93_9ACTN|nr:hypothetical protein [Streptomyces alfalfae]APY88587.1 hypothetical protein A7J05_25470 [Streptomyces alfalfae]AYA18999.1 hypothetical protein D3X13_24625 [Streptomyces fradiae]RXX36471.1 hypothetical protein DCW30_31690 [Streptomyces alfalfae]RZM90404.1 hypothetical protein D4104_24775 [Streptomyces alfalfae]
MKFDMGDTTLAVLGKDTAGSSDDLGTLIHLLVQAAEPLEGKFNGAGKATFDSFKLRADEITADLSGALSSILGGQAGMEEAFGTGDDEQADNAQQNMSAANFEAARFSG